MQNKNQNRLVLAITVLGMGVNFPTIVQLFTADYPTTLEKYFKEIGRAGCLGKPPRLLVILTIMRGIFVWGLSMETSPLLLKVCKF